MKQATFAGWNLPGGWLEGCLAHLIEVKAVPSSTGAPIAMKVEYNGAVVMAEPIWGQLVARVRGHRRLRGKVPCPQSNPYVRIQVEVVWAAQSIAFWLV